MSNSNSTLLSLNKQAVEAVAPVIGITTYGRNEDCEFHLPDAYVDAIQKAGGVPVLLPPKRTNLKRILDIVDGVVFSGGGDIDPSLYNGEPHPTIHSLDSERDAFEFALAKQLLTTDIPTLGICRGLQMLSIASGATLIAHIPDDSKAIDHRLDHPRCPIHHEVQVQRGSRLFDVIKDSTVSVASWHHQAVKAVPSGWKITAEAADGIIEALEYSNHPWMVAVQWHPELSPDNPAHCQLFKALIRFAGLRTNSRLC